MKSYIKLAFICLIMIFQSAFAGDIHEGKYDLISPPQKTSAPAGKVEVVELFWYTCPHCYRFDENYLKKWKKNKPANVHFIHMPAVFGDNDRRLPLAKAYYVAEALQILDKVHTPLFKAIHDNNENLDSRDAVQRFFAKYGVSKKDFDKNYDSFWVNTQIKRAKVMTAGYDIHGVPAVVVNGKYLLSSEKANGYAELLKVVEHLVEKESSSAK